MHSYTYTPMDVHSHTHTYLHKHTCTVYDNQYATQHYNFIICWWSRSSFSRPLPLHWAAWSLNTLSPHHLYADDSQLYVSFASGDSAAALNGLQSCLASVQSWMSTNKLKQNPDKTEFLLSRNERQRRKCLSMFPIELFGVKTNPATSARNFGVIFDKKFHLTLTYCCSL